MPRAYVEASDDRFDYYSDWQETIDDTGTSDTHLSNDVQENVRVGYVPANKVRSATRFFLGFAYCDTGSPYRLHRENPHADPEFPWLYAYDVSIKKLGPKANTDISPVTPKIESPFYAGFFFANYEKAIVTVRYRSFRCRFRPDDQIDANTDEWKRNVYFDVVPKVEALSADGVSQLHWDEGPAGVLNVPFPSPVAALKTQTGFVLNWLNVPTNYLSLTSDYFFPTKIINCMGKLNSDLFLDTFNEKTLYMGPPTFNIKPAPVASDDPYDPLYYADLSIPLDYFEPEKGVVSAYYGHSLFPWRVNGKWYHAVREDNTSEVLPSAAFSTILENVNE